MEQLFDTVMGLPVHPLVVHAVVVLGPLTALLAVLYAFVPRWRGGLRWPLVLLGVVSAVSAWIAEESGEMLEERLESIGPLPAGLHEHVEAGELAKVALLILLVVIVVAVFGIARPAAESGALATVAAVLTLAAAGFAGYATVTAGHTGADVVWGDLIDNTVPADSDD